MSFYTALSGLNAAQMDISTTANNIANAGTTGFKSSRIEFADLYSDAPWQSRNTTVGSGVMVSQINPIFSQGAVTSTLNSLDMAIQGQGFFALQPTLGSAGVVYSRAGAFHLDSQGYVIDAFGQHLAAYPVNSDGSVVSQNLTSLLPLQVPAASGAPNATSLISLGVNLPASAANLGGQISVPPGVPFDPADPTSYAVSTSVQIFDVLGVPDTATIYFTKTQDATAALPESMFEARIVVGGVVMEAGAADALTFDTAGVLISPTAAVSFQQAGGGGTPISIDFSGTTQLATGFSVQSVSQNGYGIGSLQRLDVNESGVVWANYSNGQVEALGKVAVATFTNMHGLKQIGHGAFAATNDSGLPRFGEAGDDGFGNLLSGSLERSNVDLTSELVNLISAQRNYQASAKAIETMTALVQTLMNIRS